MPIGAAVPGVAASSLGSPSGWHAYVSDGRSLLAIDLDTGAITHRVVKHSMFGLYAVGGRLVYSDAGQVLSLAGDLSGLPFVTLGRGHVAGIDVIREQ